MTDGEQAFRNLMEVATALQSELAEFRAATTARFEEIDRLHHEEIVEYLRRLDVAEARKIPGDPSEFEALDAKVSALELGQSHVLRIVNALFACAEGLGWKLWPEKQELRHGLPRHATGPDPALIDVQPEALPNRHEIHEQQAEAQ